MTEPQQNHSAQYSLESEQAVIGSVLLNQEAYFEVSAFLKADDFYLHKHRWLWDAFVELDKNKTPFDLVTVMAELERHSHLEEVGGLPYLTQLLTNVPTSLHAEAYGRQVQRESMARRTTELAVEIAKISYGADGPTETYNQVYAAMTALGERMSLGRDIRHVGAIASEYYDDVKVLSENPNDFVGTRTGLVDLDAFLGGLRAPDLITVAGRPGLGKTAMMLGVGRYAAMTLNKSVAIFSLEMSEKQVVERLVSTMTGINLNVLHRGGVQGDEWDKIWDAIQAVDQSRIFIDDSPALTVGQIEAKCNKHAAVGGLDLVIVDYMQLMSGSKPRYSNRVEEVSEISRHLKNAAKSLNVPFLAGAQLSRAIEQRADHRPVLSDLRESGSIEQDSDVVIFLDKDRLVIAKNRHGSTEDVPIYFNRPTASFHNAVRCYLP